MTNLKSFEITYRVGRTTMTWQRFAESKELAIVSAMKALHEEYLDRKFVISDVKETSKPSQVYKEAFRPQICAKCYCGIHTECAGQGCPCGVAGHPIRWNVGICDDIPTRVHCVNQYHICRNWRRVR